MKKILALALFAVALVSCRQTMQTDGFKLSGQLEGLQVGDTLFLKLFIARLERRRDRYHIGGKGGDFLGFYSYGTYYFLFIDASA